MQLVLPEIKKLGGQLLAISPQLPDQSLEMVRERGIDFEVLSDLGNKVAGKYGLVFTLPQELKELYPSFGIDIPKANGDESYELPVPASYVVDRDGMIILDFVEIDYTKRLEPDLILKALENV